MFLGSLRLSENALRVLEGPDEEDIFIQDNFSAFLRPVGILIGLNEVQEIFLKVSIDPAEERNKLRLFLFLFDLAPIGQDVWNK